MYYERPEVELTGDPKLCRKCGHTRSEHSTTSNCPGGKGYFDNKFDYDGKLEVEYRPIPVCPECGYAQNDWHESFSNCYDGEVTRITCDDCEKEFDVELHVEYSFSSMRVDHEQERIIAEKEAVRKQAKHELCLSFKPGTRVMVKQDSWSKAYAGRVGVVSNEKLPKCTSYVDVILDPKNNDKPYHTNFDPNELERI